ncbi:hypothetical protein CBS101457_004125 [Exobasidium rhododendri]|nr:hypothetical protein CBS101457_004125 [Exobasidium rhododendri]
MDLTNLRESLDSSSREKHPAYTSAKKSESRLTRDFKSAALQLTTLYRTSLSTSKRSYASGYAQSLNDILEVVLLRLQQSPTSAPGIRSQQQQPYQPYHNHHQRQSSAIESDREELKWLVRYLRARIEAIKAESEEEEEKVSSEDEEEEELTQKEGPSKVIKKASEEVVATSSKASSSSLAEAGKKEKEDTVHLPPASGVDVSLQHDLVNEPESMASLAPPISAIFNFTPPSTSIPSFPSAPPTHRTTSQHGTTVKRKIKGGQGILPSGGGTPSNYATPVFITPASASSVSSEEETLSQSPQQHTPSRRSLTRSGKRSAGRDKSSGLDLYGKSINAKRRRGMGDRKDDDRRDDNLH